MYDKVNSQICVYKTQKKLIEFTDKLISAGFKNYAKIHAGSGEKDGNGRKLLSRIGVRVSEYANGNTTNTADANLTVTDIDMLYQYACRGLFGRQEDTAFLSQEKIIAARTQNGRAPVTKIVFARQSKDKNSGENRRLPIICTIENGTGIPKRNGNGGIFMQKESYKKSSGLTICLSDLDFYTLIDHVKHFVDVWEIITEAKLLKQAKQAKMEEQA